MIGYTTMSTSESLVFNRPYCGFTLHRFVDRDMVMRHREGGVGHIDPVTCARRRQLDQNRDKAFRNAIEEVAESDSDTYSELPDEEVDPSASESGDEDTESFEMLGS